MTSIMPGILLPALEEDGKQLVVTSPSTDGFKTWFTGVGDSGSIKGAGNKFHLSWSAGDSRGEKTVEFSFNSPTEIHDGQVIFKPVDNWSFDDSVTFYAVLPSTNVSVNDSGEGNCNSIDTGQGFNIIIPAISGAHDVDLAKAVPVPSDDSTGYWDVNHNTGVISMSASPGSARWNLITAEIKVAFLMKIPLGHQTGVLDIDVYKVEWIHPNWKMVMKIDKQSDGAGDVAAWLLCFRRDTSI